MPGLLDLLTESWQSGEALAERKAVEVERDRLVDAGVERTGADPADRYKRAYRQDRLAEVEAGHQFGKVGDLRRLQPLEPAAVERGHDHRHFQDRFLPLPRSDQDLAL